MWCTHVVYARVVRRAWVDSSVGYVQIICVIECTSREHGLAVREALAAKYPLQWGSEVRADVQTMGKGALPAF
jgi:hypothetical protein